MTSLMTLNSSDFFFLIMTKSLKYSSSKCEVFFPLCPFNIFQYNPGGKKLVQNDGFEVAHKSMKCFTLFKLVSCISLSLLLSAL